MLRFQQNGITPELNTVNTRVKATLFCSKVLYQIGDAAYLREYLYTMS